MKNHEHAKNLGYHDACDDMKKIASHFLSGPQLTDFLLAVEELRSSYTERVREVKGEMLVTQFSLEAVNY